MASRNKKGKVHGIFKSEFQISFFHKPTMEETDFYYYVILEDTVFLKMRLLYNIVLIIDEVYPLTSSYIESFYERIFNLLKDQTAVTSLVSLIGNTISFRPTCYKMDTPIVEYSEFLDCSKGFYTKFKNYCGNDPAKYGFYLLALRDDTFDIIRRIQTNKDEEYKTTTVEEKLQPDVDNKPPIINTTSIINEIDEEILEGILPESILELKRFIYEGKPSQWFNEINIHIIDNSKAELKINTATFEVGYRNTELTIIADTNLSVGEKMDFVSMIDTFTSNNSAIVSIVVNYGDVLEEILHDFGWNTNDNRINRNRRYNTYSKASHNQVGINR